MEKVPEKPEQPRKLIWLVDSLVRLTGFPPVVRRKLGFALYQAQIGQKHESAKILHGFAEKVWQVRADDPGGTYRAVYGKLRNRDLQRELDLIRQRLQLARKLARK